MPGPAFLRGETVELMTFEAEDVEFVRDVLNHSAVWPTVGGQVQPTNLALERTFFEKENRDDDLVRFVVGVSGAAVGVIELGSIDWESGVAELSIWIDPDHHGNGYGTDAVRVIAEYAFDHLRLHKLFAEIYAFNERSIRAFERVGFALEGELRQEAYVDGEFVDVYRFGRLSTD